MKTPWYYKPQIFDLHLVGLICRNTRLECQQVFFVDAIGFCENLSPAILAG